MEPEDIARQHAAFFGSYVGFLIVSSLVGLLLAFFNKIKAMMQYPALRVIVEPGDFVRKGGSSDEKLGLRDPIKEAEELMNQDRQRYDENSDFLIFLPSLSPYPEMFEFCDSSPSPNLFVDFCSYHLLMTTA